MWWRTVRPYNYSYERYLEKKRQREKDGCEAYSPAFLEQKLREWNGG